MKLRRSLSVGLLYARFSKADLAAVRAIKAAGKSPENPDGLTGGEKVVLDHILRLSRREGFSFATNARLAKDLGVTRSSVSCTLRRLRLKGWLFQAQKNSKLVPAWRFVVSTEEQRAKLTDLFGEPGENWSIIVDSVEEFLAAKRGTDCSGSDKSSPTEKLLTSLPAEGEEAKLSIPGEQTIHPTSPGDPEVTPPSEIPPRVSLSDWGDVVCTTEEFKVFARHYGRDNLLADERFCRSLGRAMRHGKFSQCPARLAWLYRQPAQPRDVRGNVLPYQFVLRNLHELSLAFVQRRGMDVYEKLVEKEEKLHANSEADIIETFGKGYYSMFNKKVGGRHHSFGPGCDSLRLGWLTSLDKRKEHGIKYIPEWSIFLYAFVNHPDQADAWSLNDDLRLRLFNSLLEDNVNDFICEKYGVDMLYEICNSSSEHVAKVRELMRKDIVPYKLRVYRAFELGTAFLERYNNNTQSILSNAA